jgi:ankyrin repeat protein
MEDKSISIISLLLRAMIIGDYKNALDFVENDKFDPNEKTKACGAPILTALITVLSGMKKFECDPDAKKVFLKIIKNEKFNPNETDTERETVLMHIARTRNQFEWMIPYILENEKTDVTIKNYMNKTAVDIALQHDNSAMADLMMIHRLKKKSSHLPKKIAGLKKKPVVDKEVSLTMVNRVEYAFSGEAKDNPFSLYWVLVNFFKHEYDECVRIINDIHFDPNETDKWEEPALTSLIYYSQDSSFKYDEDGLKKVAEAIMNHRGFDVNAIDADSNTVLMVCMSFKKLNWLTRE